MKIEFKLTLDKNNEAEIAYCKMLDLFFASYNTIKMIQSDLPDLMCEACDCDSEIEYRFKCSQELNIEDLEKILRSSLSSDNITIY